MATPFPFGSGNVLTAAQLNAVTTLPVSTKTATYVLTAADIGTRVVMNSASATTITVNTSIFGASDKVEILNIGAGVCTVTAGTCTVGSTGTLALAQNAGGTLTFISASASVFTKGDVAASASGLAFITSAAVSGTSVSVNNCFSATYNNYKIIYDFTVGDQNMTFRLRVGGSDNSTSNYDRVRLIASGSSAGVATTSAATSWTDFLGSDGASFWIMDIMDPFAAAKTSSFLANGYNSATATILALGSLQQREATSFDGFTIAGSNSMTGTVYVYGYSLS